VIALQLRLSRNNDVRVVTQFRADGWPICPFCENDELACIREHLHPKLELVDHCYVCGSVEVVEEEP
jgi:hypothetical protein